MADLRTKCRLCGHDLGRVLPSDIAVHGRCLETAAAKLRDYEEQLTWAEHERSEIADDLRELREEGLMDIDKAIEIARKLGRREGK